MTQRYIDLSFDDATPRSFGGFDNENEATVIRLKVLTSDAKYYLEIERACGKHDKYCSNALPVADGYATFEIHRDLTHETLYVQGVMKVDGACRKTARVRVGFSRSINALDELPESHPSWADSVDERIDSLEIGMKEALTYTPQTLTDEQQEQARENITVAKSYQIPTTTINDNEVRVDGWAAAPIGIGRPSGFSIILSDVLNGALPFFVANGMVFLCTGVDSSGAHKELTFVGFASSGSSLSAITYKNARWEDGIQVIYIYPGSVNPNDIDYCAKVTYYYVGSYGYIYGPSYKELMEERDFAVKHPLAVVNGKFDNAILPLTCVDDVNKSITYARIDVLPSGAHQIRGLTIADGQPLHIIDLTTPPPYTVPASGIPKTDLAQDVQTSLNKADTAISLGLTAATPGQIIKVKAVQDGKPTAWEAADMPGEDWELIAHINVADDVEKEVTAWQYNNLPRYKCIAYKKVNLVGSNNQIASGCGITINSENTQPSGMTYGKLGSPFSCIGIIYVMPFGWTHWETGDANSPDNIATGGARAMYNALPLSDNAITSIRLYANSIYKIASGEIWLYGKKG